MDNILTPQDIAQADKLSGWTTPPAGSPVQSRADELRSMRKASTSTPATAPATSDTYNPISSLGGMASETVNAAGAGLKKTFTSLPSAMTQANEQAGKGDILGGMGTLAKGALDTASGAVETAFSPFTGVMSQTLKDLDKTTGGAVSAIAQKAPQVVPQLHDWITTHPQLAGAAGDIINILGTMVAPGVGKSVEGAIAPTIEKTASTVTSIANKAKPIINDIKATVATKAAAKNTNAVTNLIKQDAETMTPTMKKAAIEEGRQTVKNTKTGATVVDYAPTSQVTRATTLLTDGEKVGSGNVITPKDAPNVVYAKTKGAISKLGSQAETYLEKNAKPVTNAEHAQMFNTLRTKAEKNMTDSQLSAYDEQMKLFSKQLVGRGGMNTANYYKALKDWESNIAETLPRGKEALMDPTGVASAKIHAAADVRSAVRDMIGSKHPEFQPQMQDIASLYEAKDNALFNASKAKTQTLAEKHPTAAKALKYGAIGAAGVVAGPTIVGGVKSVLP